MSRTRSIWLVARREILERGRSKAFLFSLAITLALILAALILPMVLGGGGGEKLGLTGPVDPVFRQTLTAGAAQANVDVEIENVADRATGEQRLREGTLDALYVASPDGPGEYVVQARSSELGGAVLSQLVGQAAAAGRVQQLLGEAGIDPVELQAAATPPAVVELDPAEPGQEVAFLFANVGVILLFIAIFSFGTWVLTGVVEEKQSRVVEVVLSTVEARDLLIGKVLGIGLLGLAQLVAMVAIGLGAAVATGRVTLPATTPVAVVQLLLWFVLGYLLYSTALGVLGALASRMEEASNASSPVSFVAMGAYFFALIVVVDDPSGLAARIGSFIPPVAPMVVPLRAALGAIEPWEIAVSALLTAATIWALFVFGGRVYRGAVLRTGARVRLRDAWRAAAD